MSTTAAPAKSAGILARPEARALPRSGSRRSRACVRRGGLRGDQGPADRRRGRGFAHDALQCPALQVGDLPCGQPTAAKRSHGTRPRHVSAGNASSLDILIAGVRMQLAFFMKHHDSHQDAAQGSHRMVYHRALAKPRNKSKHLGAGLELSANVFRQCIEDGYLIDDDPDLMARMVIASQQVRLAMWMDGGCDRRAGPSSSMLRSGTCFGATAKIEHLPSALAAAGLKAATMTIALHELEDLCRRSRDAGVLFVRACGSSGAPGRLSLQGGPAPHVRASLGRYRKSPVATRCLAALISGSP